MIALGKKSLSLRNRIPLRRCYFAREYSELGQCLINDHFVISTHQTYVDLGLANRRALANIPLPRSNKSIQIKHLRQAKLEMNGTRRNLIWRNNPGAVVKSLGAAVVDLNILINHSRFADHKQGGLGFVRNCFSHSLLNSSSVVHCYSPLSKFKLGVSKCN